jgi:mitogen-activated protein kinase organizer 1
VSLSSGQILQEYHGSHTHESFKIESCIASDDCHVISCSEDGDIVVYDLVQGTYLNRTSTISKSLSTASSHLSPALSSISHHPSKPLLLTASYNGTVAIWNSNKVMGK